MHLFFGREDGVESMGEEFVFDRIWNQFVLCSRLRFDDRFAYSTGSTQHFLHFLRFASGWIEDGTEALVAFYVTRAFRRAQNPNKVIFTS